MLIASLGSRAYAQEPAAPAEPVGESTTAPSRAAHGGVLVTVPHAGELSAEEARTLARLMVDELARHKAPAGTYEIDLGPLGGRTLVTLVQSATRRKSQLLLTGTDELIVATPRLVDALLSSRSASENETTETVVRQQARQPLVKAVSPGFFLGMTGMTAMGVPLGASGGVDLGLLFHLDKVELAAHGRAGGIGNSDTSMSYVSLDMGAHYNFVSEASSPFVGGGLGFAYFNAKSFGGDGAGLDAHADVGINFLRASRVGVSTSIRADVPLFQLQGGGITKYAVPLSLNFGLTFR